MPSLRVEYIRPLSLSRDSRQILPSDIRVIPQELSEYWAYCSGQSMSPEQFSLSQIWQFAVFKNEFLLNDLIPYHEKLDRTRSLLNWHQVLCKYSPFDYQDQSLKDDASKCFELKKYLVEFVQTLAVGQEPQEIPEAIFKQIKTSLASHVENQKAILQELQGKQTPIWVQAGKQMKLIWPQDICFVSSQADVGLQLYTNSGQQYPLFLSLAVLERQLASEPYFMRTSRQHLVNLRQIETVTSSGRGRDLTFRSLPSDLQARVSERFLKAFIERLKG